MIFTLFQIRESLSKMVTKMISQIAIMIVILAIVIIETISFNAQKLNKNTFRKNAYFKGQIPINYNLNNRMNFQSENASAKISNVCLKPVKHTV